MTDKEVYDHYEMMWDETYGYNGMDLFSRGINTEHLLQYYRHYIKSDSSWVGIINCMLFELKLRTDTPEEFKLEILLL